MKRGNTSINKFVFFYIFLLSLYLIGRLANNTYVYIGICILSGISIVTMLVHFNNNIKKLKYSSFSRLIFVIIIPMLILFGFIMFF